MAPSMLIASTDSMNSVRLSIRIMHPVAEADAAAAQRPGQRGDARSSSPHVVVLPRNRSAVASGCISACRVELVDPVLPPGQVGLLGRRVGSARQVRGQRRAPCRVAHGLRRR